MDRSTENSREHNSDRKPRHRSNRGRNYLNRNQREYNPDIIPRFPHSDVVATESTAIHASKEPSVRNHVAHQPYFHGNRTYSENAAIENSYNVNQSNFSRMSYPYEPQNRGNSSVSHQSLPEANIHKQNHRHRYPKHRNACVSDKEDCDNSKPHSVEDSRSLFSQRGKIVGGRYIRKHATDPMTHSSSFSTNGNNVNCEENLNSQQNSYIPSKDRNISRDSQKKTYYNYDYKRDYEYEKMNNFGASTRKKNYPNSGKCNENISSPTDVYHYSSASTSTQNTNLSTLAIFNKESQSSRFSKHNEDEANQRELLILHLSKGECECLVCCDSIRVRDQVWHCLSCYHVFHLRCIRKWARSEAAAVEDGGWRCPACQSVTIKVPYDYFCFCGKQKNPDVNYHITPHSCGEICSRKRLDCSHLCKELCHPGPCPPCLIVVQKTCPCGKTVKTTTCKQSIEETCSSICDKLLNCGVHSCKSLCHSGVCPPCEDVVSQDCFCNKSTRTVPCTQDTSRVKYFSCGQICEKLLNCELHKCNSICHYGACDLCSLSVQVIKSCACGKMSIEELVAAGQTVFRKSCVDPVPTCNEKCEKILFCGPKDNPHKCQSLCHTGECPPCLLTTSMKCRCGAFTKEFKCEEISPEFVYHCEKRCNRRKDCGRHKCLNKCCVNVEHKCDLVCNKKLSCGNHQCQETCHGGNCPTCWNVSFDELRCHCGESVIYPPIQCGTKPPECTKPCIRRHSCEHDVKHYCHSEATCPPCTSLTVKWCYGHHKQCGSVMCFLEGVSCGMPCQKSLPCGRHECQLTCHPGPCLKPGEKCTQLCAIPRTSCAHPCGNSCHDGSCPDTPCKAQVTLTCPCGHRSEMTTCYESAITYRLMSVSVLASKMQEIKEGQSVNLNDVLGRKSKNSKLQCNEECAVIERNKRLAVALQIQNPDLSCSPGPPNYSEFLKTEAKKSPSFVADVYEKICQLVQLAKESKQKCRSHSFPPMNRDQRRVVHELAEFFGCETQSYDEEPKKNVVVTAHKNKCWLPFVSIMTIVQRDMGFRKGPAPVIAQRESKNSSGGNNVTNNQKKKIDYFDYKE